MPIDEKLITQEVLNNTLKKEILSEIKVQSPPKLGKVRTVYDISERKLLMLTSDALSTHDIVHKRLVYAKGENLDSISAYFFNKTRSIIENHLIDTIAPNTWLVAKAKQILVEMVFRKYLTGSGWKEYAKEDGPEKGINFCGVSLRQGYRRNEMLDEIIFTPTAKGQAKDFPIDEFKGLNPEEDDPKVTPDLIRKNYKAFGLRKPEDLDHLMEAALRLYNFIHADLASKGSLLADTKWEFGYLPDGKICLIDECVTPDSSRIWNKSKYEFNPEKNEFTIVQDDKQHFRNYIESLGLHTPDKKKELAEHWMDDVILKEGVLKYCNIREKITGTLPVITTQPRKEAILDVLAGAGFLK